jgi:hypothetical protein
MKKRLLIFGLLTSAFTISLRGQGDFRNLDFESAQIIFGDNGLATTNALPAWSAFSGTNQLATIPYNAGTFFPEVGLYGSNPAVISGNFSVDLNQGGYISQTGVVPPDANSLLFKAGDNNSFALIVSIGGQNLSYIALSNGSNYTLFGADVSTFAGQTAPLTLFAPTAVAFIDDIQFSPQAIPEPSTLALFSLGGVLIAARRFRPRLPRC